MDEATIMLIQRLLITDAMGVPQNNADTENENIDDADTAIQLAGEDIQRRAAIMEDAALAEAVGDGLEPDRRGRPSPEWREAYVHSLYWRLLCTKHRESGVWVHLLSSMHR